MKRMMGRKRKSSSPDTWLPATASKALKKEEMVCNSLLSTEVDGHQKQRSALSATGSDGEEEEEECDVDYVRPSLCSPGGQEEDRELHLCITVDDGDGAGAHRTRELEADPSVPWDRDAEEEGLESCWLPSNSECSSDDEFGQLDIDLERKSREHNLTSGNIRSILHEVITNEHVVAMMKAAIRETQDLPLFEPKMTRSRLKQVVEQGESIHNLNLSPIRGALTKPPQFVDIPLEEEEDSSDEEYCPDDDEDDETAEESFLSDENSLGWSPRVSKGPVPGMSRQQPDDSPLEQTDPATQKPRCSRHLRVDAAPMGPPPPPPSSSSTPPPSPHHLLLLPAPADSSFLERLHAVEEELNLSQDCHSYQGLNDEDASGLVALRTRSKRPLRDVPLGTLEAELRAPDITPDMYEQNPAVLEEDKHWTHWLQGLMDEVNEEEGDDDDDPEYNFLEDADVPDKEDYRTDRAVRITKKEVNQLLEELFDTFQEEVAVEEVEGEEEEISQQHVPKYNVPQALRFEAPLASMLTERRRVVRAQYEAAQQKRALHDTPGHAPGHAPSVALAPTVTTRSQTAVPPAATAVPRPPFSLVLDHGQKLQLQQQVQQHVQLLTQVQLLSRPVESLQHEASLTKHYLEELAQFARRKEEAHHPRQPAFRSIFRASNLQAALELLQEVQVEEEATTREQTSPPPPTAPLAHKWLPKKRSYAFPMLPADTAWLFATRSVFLYPELLPTRNLDPSKDRQPRKNYYTPGENCLIALGLKHFENTVKSGEQMRTYLIPNPHQKVSRHIAEMCGPNGPTGNVIKVFCESGELPAMPLACNAALQGEQRPPVDRDVSLLPNWLKKSQAAIHKVRLSSSSGQRQHHYPRTLPKTCTLRLHPAMGKKGPHRPRPACVFNLYHSTSLPLLARPSGVTQVAEALPVQQSVVLLAESAVTVVPGPSSLGQAMLVPAQEPVSLAAAYPASIRGAAASPTTGSLHPPESSQYPQSSLTGAPPGGRRSACRKQPSRRTETSSKVAPVRSASQSKPDRRGTARRRSPPPSPRAAQEARASRVDKAQARCRLTPILPDLPEEEWHPLSVTPPPLLSRNPSHLPLTSPLPPPTPASATVTVPTVQLTMAHPRPTLLPQGASDTPYVGISVGPNQSIWAPVRGAGGTTLNQTSWTPVKPVCGAGSGTLNQSMMMNNTDLRMCPQGSSNTQYVGISVGPNQHIWAPVRPVYGAGGGTLNQSSWTPTVRPMCGAGVTTLKQTGDYVLVQVKDSSQMLCMRVQNQTPDPHPVALTPQQYHRTPSQKTSDSDSHLSRSSFEEQLHRLVEGLREEPDGVEERGEEAATEERKREEGEREVGEGAVTEDRAGGEGKVTEESEEGGGARSSASESVTRCTLSLEEEEEMDARGEERRSDEEASNPGGGVEWSSESSLSSSYLDNEEYEVRGSITSSDSGGDKVTENEGQPEEGGGGEEEESGGGGEEEGEHGGGDDRGEGGGGESSGQRDGDAGGGGGGEGGRGGEEEGDRDEGQSGGERDEDKDGDGEQEEEEEDFDDLTQDEDEEEVMSSASEESVLSVPELQETMKKLTWLASEGRGLCGDGDSEEDHDSPASPGSQNSQEDNSEEEEEGGQGAKMAAGRGTGSKATEEEEEAASGEGTPRRSGKGPGRGRGRARQGSLRRSRRQERHSKDTAKLLLLYDDHILDNDPLRDSKDTAFAQAYLNRVREALADTPGKVEEFLGLLYDFEQTGEGRDVVQLFKSLRSVLVEQPDLLRDFAGFLLPEQALECGLFEEQQAFERSRRFLRQLEISFGENPSQYQKIIKALQGGDNLSQASIDELKSQMATLLKGHTHLQGEFWVFFDELRPPPARPGQFEEAHWPEEGGAGSDGGEAVGPGGVGAGAAGGFEEVTLPDLEEEEEGHKIQPMADQRRRRKIGSRGNYKECDWLEKDCSCPCHESSHNAKLRKHRRKGCPRCHGNKASDGVSRAMKSLDPLYSLSVSPTANRLTESSLEEGAEKDRELESELKEELDSDVNSPQTERGAASSWEGVEEASSFPPEASGQKVDEEELEEMREDEEERKDSDGEATSPGAKRKRRGEGEGGEDSPVQPGPARPSPPADPPVPAKNMSLTPSGQKVILWTREADRVILTTCQQEGANQSTFQDISAQLGNKTPNEVSRRFRDLMQLFHTAARQTNSEDEAPPTEPPSTNEEEAGVK